MLTRFYLMDPLFNHLGSRIFRSISLQSLRGGHLIDLTKAPPYAHTLSYLPWGVIIQEFDFLLGMVEDFG